MVHISFLRIQDWRKTKLQMTKTKRSFFFMFTSGGLGLGLVQAKVAISLGNARVGMTVVKVADKIALRIISSIACMSTLSF